MTSRHIFCLTKIFKLLEKNIGIRTLDVLALILQLTLRDVTMCHSQHCELLTLLAVTNMKLDRHIANGY